MTQSTNIANQKRTHDRMDKDNNSSYFSKQKIYWSFEAKKYKKKQKVLGFH